MSDWPFPDVSLGIAAELDVGVSDDDQKQAVAARAWSEWTTPRTLFPKFSVNAINGTVATRVGEGPNTERQWELKRFVMAPSNPVGAVQPAGVTVFLFRDVGGGRGLVTPANFEAMELLWEWTAFPIIQVFSRYEVTIVQGEDLIVVVTAGAAVSLSGNAQVIDSPLVEAPLYMPWQGNGSNGNGR